MRLARLVAGVAGFIGAQLVEIVFQRQPQRFGALGIDTDRIGIALEQVIPQRVLAVDAAALLKQPADPRIAFAPGQRVQRVALRQLLRAGVPIRQIDEAHPRANRPRGIQRGPLRGELGERRVAARGARVVTVIAVDRNRQRVRQRQLGQPLIEITRPLDQHRMRPDLLDPRPHQPRAGRRVVADADDLVVHG